LQRACKDVRYLLDRGYDRYSALNFVSGHYRLDKKERNFVARSVFSGKEIEDHGKRRLPLSRIKGKTIVVDGYNILIAAECALGRGPLIKSDDGFHRDALGVFGRYKTNIYTTVAIERILAILKKYKPDRVVFLFDSQVSRSGQLAALVRKRMAEAGLGGEARTTPNADYEIKQMNEITATSDSAIIEKVGKVVDIIGVLK